MPMTQVLLCMTIPAGLKSLPQFSHDIERPGSVGIGVETDLDDVLDALDLPVMLILVLWKLSLLLSKLLYLYRYRDPILKCIFLKKNQKTQKIIHLLA